jgi:hypothetical protein
LQRAHEGLRLAREFGAADVDWDQIVQRLEVAGVLGGRGQLEQKPDRADPGRRWPLTSDPLEDLDHLLLGHGNLLSMADPEQERREATRELDAAVGRLNAAMLRASDAGMSAGAVAKATGLSVRRVYRIVRLQRKGKP